MTTIPNIRYYACMKNNTGTGKTPKYVITAQAGYYPPMDEIVGKDGKISMYLQANERSGGSKKSNAPAMKLQAKNSLNFTGLKDYFVDGRLSGYAYGYPFDKTTYSKDNKPNRYIDFKNDGFLFKIHQDETDKENPIPTKIEMLVIARGKAVIASYCKMLVEGGFDDVLNELRQQCANYIAL